MSDKERLENLQKLYNRQLDRYDLHFRLTGEPATPTQVARLERLEAQMDELRMNLGR